MFVSVLMGLMLLGMLLAFASAVGAIWLHRSRHKAHDSAVAPPSGRRRGRTAYARTIAGASADPASNPEAARGALM